MRAYTSNGGPLPPPRPEEGAPVSDRIDIFRKFQELPNPCQAGRLETAALR